MLAHSASEAHPSVSPFLVPASPDEPLDPELPASSGVEASPELLDVAPDELVVPLEPLEELEELDEEVPDVGSPSSPLHAARKATEEAKATAREARCPLVMLIASILRAERPPRRVATGYKSSFNRDRSSHLEVVVARPLLVVTAVCLALVGCDKKPTESSQAPAGSTSAATTASAPVASASAAAVVDAGSATAEADAGGGGKHRDMANCPTSAQGATVAIKDVPGGVELSVTGKDEAATADIRTRTKKLVEADKNEAASGVKHTGHGEGGGRYGRCTIVMRNTQLETAEIPGGIKATVKAKEASEVDWLRRETRDRDKESKTPNAETAGAQRMSHCPSSVAGAKTEVKDAKDGVVVTVTGPEAAVKEIRERAAHTVAVSKMPDPKKAEHNGAGQGGGGLGRCPVVVEGDTAVTVKELPNGAEITVSTKKDVPALQKEAKARAAALKL